MPAPSNNNLLRVLGYGRPYLWHLLVSSTLNMFTIACDVGFLYLLKLIVDTGFVEQNLVLIKWVALGALLIVVLRSIISYLSSYLLQYIEEHLTMNFQDTIYRHIQEQSMDFHISQSPGYLITLIFYDAQAALRIITSFSGTLIKEVFRIPAVILFLFSLHSRLALFSLLFFPLVVLSIRFFGKTLSKATIKMQDNITDLYTTIEQTLSHMDIVKTFANEREETKKFRDLNKKMFDSSLKAHRAIGLSSPVNQLIKMISIIILVFLGTREVVLGNLSVGIFTTFLASSYYLYGSFSSLSSWYFSLLSSLVSAKRIFKVLDEKPKIVSPPSGIKLRSFEKELKVDNISFRYSGRNNDVLQGISLSIKKSETTAIVGPSGSGKSTLIKLFLRLYDVSAGEIIIDGHSITEFDVPSLKSLYGVATQDAGIFQDTVENAIIYGTGDNSLENMKNAAKIADIHVFVKKLPQGYQTVIGERGLKLSGGEAQRVALARAILRQPEILVLDEALSSVDAPTERVILRRISENRKGKTNIFISHRLQSVVHADRIIVLESGCIVDQGSHQELMSRPSSYKEWFLIQQTGFEKTDI
ncbi:ABC transporter ATP-binding protein [Thermodesulfobacteriota bacterium]